MRNTAASFLIFFLPVIITSCQKSDVGDYVDKVDIRISETPSPENTTLSLYSTGGNFTCENVLINCSFHRTENTFYIDYGGTYLPSGVSCNGYHDESHWATSSLSIDQVRNGNYLLEISNNNEVLRASIRIDDRTISIDKNGSGETVDFFQSDYILHRIPKDAVWGYASDNTDLTPIKDTLNSLGASNYQPLLEEGNYSAFKINEGKVIVNDLYNDFLVKSTLDTATLKNVIGSFNVRVYVYTGKGDYFQLN